MAYVKVKTSTGTVNFHYTISTPSNESAKAIDKNLPTIVFLHPVFIAQDIFQPQFGDAQLRRYNLIAIDSRAHGETFGKVGKKYNSVTAAEDVAKIMESLRLPACHFVGVSVGASIALQLAISYPKKVLSLFMISPLSITEPIEVAEGRQEIYDCWVEGIKARPTVDKIALLDAVYGASQLGFNSTQSSLISALTTRTLPQGMRNWGINNLDDFHAVSVKFFTDRKPHSRSSLTKIVCPVKLVHCSGDIAYPVEYAEELLEIIQGAGVDVQLITVQEASHYGNVTHAKEMNPILHDFILKNTKGSVPLPPMKVTSPFEARLIKAGWDQDDDSDDEC